MATTTAGGETGSPRNRKSPEAFRTISEVAGELDVPQHVLRFWESKFAQVRPLKRGGGRRYYRPEDVELLRRIRSLLYEEGYTIKGVQKLLKENGKRGEIARPSKAAPRLADRPSLARTKTAAIEGAIEELDGLRKLLRDARRR
ncbi:MAG: MerR family transcriptional regulator [Alphaproteobacteria bacterium]|nr:MerR family transcriptional regulator [Pseudomonadota bacterium]MDA1059278.1 MerR family transcriptional regulator [Pseudomonadota bacterium]NQV81915.1 MerR family transcriptional regulator [Alphaproteobacteria bacterium]